MTAKNRPIWPTSAGQHCTRFEQAAQNRMELIVPQLAKQYGVTEQLKAEKQMEWVRQMNACKAQAEAIEKTVAMIANEIKQL